MAVVVRSLISSSAGMYKGAAFKFTFAIEQDYPHKPPKVKCVPKVGVEYASRFFELTETVPS